MSRVSPETSNFTVSGCSYSNWTGYFSGFDRLVNGQYRDYTSVNTPNYYTKSQTKGALPVNSHHMHITFDRKEFLLKRTSTIAINGRWDMWWDTYKEHISPNTFTAHEYEIAHSKQGYEKAKSKCIAADKSIDFNAAVACAEAQKTMDLVGDTAIKLAKAFSAIRKGKLNQCLKTLGVGKPKDLVPKGLSGQWLSVQYGWLPLLSDVKAAAEHLAKQQFPPNFHFVGRSSDSDSSQKFTHLVGFGGVSYRELQYNCKSKMSLTFRKRNHAVRSMSELGISDPLLVAWELVPYSFVVDWFYPVGKYLEGLNYTDGLTFVSGYTVQYSQNLWESSTPNYHSGTTTITDVRGGAVCSARNILLDRVVLNAPPTVSLPRLKNPLSTTHMLNGLALLARAFR